MTNLEDVGATIALEYLKDYCHDRNCIRCSLLKFCRILWNDDGFGFLEDAIGDFIND